MNKLRFSQNPSAFQYPVSSQGCSRSKELERLEIALLSLSREVRNVSRVSRQGGCNFVSVSLRVSNGFHVSESNFCVRGFELGLEPFLDSGTTRRRVVWNSELSINENVDGRAGRGAARNEKRNRRPRLANRSLLLPRSFKSFFFRFWPFPRKWNSLLVVSSRLIMQILRGEQRFLRIDITHRRA